KLRRFIAHFSKGLNGIDVDGLVRQCRAELYDEIETKDIQKALVLVARALIEREPDYTKLATRMLLDDLYKNIIGHDKIDYNKFEEQYRDAFKSYIHKAVELGRLDPRMLIFNLDEIAPALKPENDDLFDYLGL